MRGCKTTCFRDAHDISPEEVHQATEAHTSRENDVCSPGKVGGCDCRRVDDSNDHNAMFAVVWLIFNGRNLI